MRLQLIVNRNLQFLRYNKILQIFIPIYYLNYCLLDSLKGYSSERKSILVLFQIGTIGIALEFGFINRKDRMN